jgi:imidazolonepropionase-like amidohydrolase
VRVKVAQLWTSGMESPRGPYVLDITDGIITSMTEVSPDDRTDVDVDTNLTALPGFIDCHEHIGIDPGDEHAQSVDDASRIILKGVRALAAMTRGGVTTIRDCGERADVEPYWVEALANDTIPGPRVIRSVTPICRTGGHAWYLGAQSDGEDGLRTAVRRNVRAGAHFIKVMATGGMGTIGSSPGAAEFTVPELKAVVDEAHRLNRKVAAHAHGGQGVDDALDAGVDSIEHGCIVTEDQLNRMAAQGTVLVITMGVGLAFEVEPGVPAAIQSRMADVNANYWTVLEAARRAGVTVTLGSDGVHGGIAQEMSYLIKAGFSPVEALTAATASAATLISREDLGRLSEGNAADIVFVEGDPTVDIDAAAQVRGVMVNGTWQIKP